jgi:hypothetical protein
MTINDPESPYKVNSYRTLGIRENLYFLLSLSPYFIVEDKNRFVKREDKEKIIISV